MFHGINMVLSMPSFSCETHLRMANTSPLLTPVFTTYTFFLFFITTVEQGVHPLPQNHLFKSSHPGWNWTSWAHSWTWPNFSRFTLSPYVSLWCVFGSTPYPSRSIHTTLTVAGLWLTMWLIVLLTVSGEILTYPSCYFSVSTKVWCTCWCFIGFGFSRV